MNKNNKHLSWCEFCCCSFIVLIIWAIAFGINWQIGEHVVINPNNSHALTFLSAFLGLLAGGSIAGFFSFEYYNADKIEFNIVRTIGYIFIGSIFIFIFLSLYSLAEVGIFKFLDWWAKILLFIGTYAVLDGIVLLDRWDAKKKQYE